MTSMDLHGSITAEERTFIETWENVAAGTNYIITENRRGDEVQTAVTGHGRKFRLSTYERMLTEEKSLDVRNNPFKNGSFRPVIVPQNVDVQSNPNAMSDDDIRRLFEASDVAWEEYMSVIDSPATLSRMVDLAEESNISIKRFRALEAAREKWTNIGKRIVNPNSESQELIDSLGPAGQPGSGGRPSRGRSSSS